MTGYPPWRFDTLRARRLLAQSQLPHIQMLRARAEKYGLTLQPILLSTKRALLLTRLVVNGHPCVLHTCPKLFEVNGRPYGRVRFTRSSLEKGKFVILWVGVPGFSRHFYVLPTEKILAAYPRSRKKIFVYVPLTPRKKETGRPSPLNWDYHRERFNLLLEGSDE